MCKISVIIPIYNVEEYLEDCLQSVFKQSLDGIEVILVDDGSTDGSGKICDKYIERAVVIHKSNGGLSSARNAGLKVATGKYVFFLDSDDWLEEDCLERLYRLGEEHNVDFVRFRLKNENGETISMGKDALLSTGLYTRDRIVSELYPYLICSNNLELGVIIGAWRSLYRRTFLSDNNLCFNEQVKYSEDVLFSTILLHKTNSFYYTDDTMYYHYRLNPASISKSFRADRLSVYKVLWQEINQYFYGIENGIFNKQIENLGVYLCFNVLMEYRRYDKKLFYKTLKDSFVKERLSVSLFDLEMGYKQKAMLCCCKLFGKL